MLTNSVPNDLCVCIPISCLFFNQEKVLVGAFSVLVKTDASFAALLVTVTEARRQESDEWRPLLPGHDSQGMKSQITTNCTG